MQETTELLTLCSQISIPVSDEACGNGCPGAADRLARRKISIAGAGGSISGAAGGLVKLRTQPDLEDGEAERDVGSTGMACVYAFETPPALLLGACRSLNHAAELVRF